MPVYTYQHVQEPGPQCPRIFEWTHGIDERLQLCPGCGAPVVKIVAPFSLGRNILSTANIKDKGFRRLRRKARGVYEED